MADLSQQTRDDVRAGTIRSAQACWPIIADYVVDDLFSVLDVGTGEGHWLDVIAEWMPDGQVVGVDLQAAASWAKSVPILKWDAEAEDALPMHDADGPRPSAYRAERWDVTLCLEVAEHLSPAGGEWLVEQLCRVSKLVVWSAAIPGQGGDGHVNEQWPVYWQERFATWGWLLEDPFREYLWGDRGVEPWYAQNLLAARPREEFGDPLYPPAPRALVHPATWAYYRGVAAP